MDFRTKININSPEFEIQHKDRVFCMGSCFAENIYKKLTEFKFISHFNPFGTLFHPQAIENAMMRIYTLEKYTENEIFSFNNLFFSWDHSTKFSSNNLENTLQNINSKLEIAHDFIMGSKTFIFTLGTAWAYQLKKGNFLVSNCHKIPQNQFNKVLLNHAQILKSIRNIVLMCRDLNEDANIIFTVSPVRHSRDGFWENNISKGSLHLALNQLIKEDLGNVYYFPSYEIVLDELRDYRFYEKDMLHPNQLAIDYIWERFSDVFFSEKTENLNKEIEKINLAVNHKPINPHSVQHRKFLYDTLKKVEQLAIELPKNAFYKEIEYLKYQIHNVH